MSAGKSLLKVAGMTAGVAAGVAGSAYVAQRALVRSLRHRTDPDAGTLGPLEFDEERRLPSHDGGSLYTVTRLAPGTSARPSAGTNGQGSDAGSSPTIVLSHGVTLSSRVWTKQFRTLPEAGVRTIAFDHRGHGESVVGDSGHNLENLACDVRTVVEGLDLYDTVLVGHSMGGVAVLAFAATFPEIARTRVRGIVLLSSLSRTYVSGARRLRRVLQQASSRFELAALMDRPEFGTLLARVGFGRSPLGSHVELTREMLAACDAVTAREAISALLGLDLTPELPKIDLPTLVVCGSADVMTPPSESRRIAELIPGARLVMLERAGHMIMLERAEELDALLLGFLREVGARLPACT
jgi:pimeloyl-ACP methyl ester carboxylesterase